MGLILIAVNVLVGGARQRLDLTKEKAYTLSDGTRSILQKLDTPVTIRFYCTQSENATPETVFLRDYARRVEDLLNEYKQAAKGKLVLQKFNPQPDSDAEDSARLDGVEGQELSNGERFYLGLAVSLLDSKQAMPFLAPDRERLLEYDLSRAISQIVTPQKPVVGVMSALPVFGMPVNPMMMQMGRQPQGQEPWVLISELKNDFDVKQVEMETDRIDDEIKVLVLIHPRDISVQAQFAIDQFILRGGKLIAFLDAAPLMDRQQQQNPMMGAMPGKGSSLDQLLKAWGLQFDTSKVVADMNFKMQLRNGTDAPAFLSLTTEGIDPDDIVTSQLDNVWLPFVGAFTGTPVPGLKQTVLLKSSAASQLVEGFLAQMGGDSVSKNFKPSGSTQALAVRLTGKFKTAFPDGPPSDATDTNKVAAASLKESAGENSVILVGDADMVYDQFALRQVQTPFGNFATPLNGNLSFAQNAVAQMTGDNDLISVRSRATQNRPFTVIKKMQAQAAQAYQSKIQDLEDSLAKTEQRLNELQQAKQGNQRFILSPEQQVELEKFRKEQAEAKIQLKEERKKLRRDIDSLETRVKWLNIAAMPLVVSVSGIGLAMYKRKRTSAK